MSKFGQTAAAQAGIVLPRGARDRSLALLETVPVPASNAPAPSLAPFAAVVPRLPIVAGAQTTTESSYVGDTRTEGNCVSVKLRKPRMVWVANDRPSNRCALGRSAAQELIERNIVAGFPSSAHSRQTERFARRSMIEEKPHGHQSRLARYAIPNA
jgi:hypothetical protein